MLWLQVVAAAVVGASVSSGGRGHVLFKHNFCGSKAAGRMLLLT